MLFVQSKEKNWTKSEGFCNADFPGSDETWDDHFRDKKRFLFALEPVEVPMGEIEIPHQ